MCCQGYVWLKKWDILRNLWVVWNQDVSEKPRSRLLYRDNICHLPDVARRVDRLQNELLEKGKPLSRLNGKS